MCSEPAVLPWYSSFSFISLERTNLRGYLVCLWLSACVSLCYTHTHTLKHTLRGETTGEDQAKLLFSFFPFRVSSHFVSTETFFSAFFQLILFSRLSLNSLTSGFQHLLTKSPHTYRGVNGDQMASPPSSSSPPELIAAPDCQNYTSERKR